MVSKRTMENITNLLLSLILFCDLFGKVIARPDPSVDNENDSEDAYYGADGSNSDSLREDEETPLKYEESKQVQSDEIAALEQQKQDKEHVYLQRNAEEPDNQLDADKFTDSDRTNEEFNTAVKENDNTEDRFQPLSKRRAKTYADNIETNDALALPKSNGRETYRVSHRKNGESVSKIQEDAGNMYINNKEPQMIRNIDDVDANEEPHEEHTRRHRMRKNSKFLQNRDRRQVQETTQKDLNLSTLNAVAEDISENDEIAIKNQIKELSSQELDELLNSLSDEKRFLLKKILEENPEESVIKREITKKAGARAVEESNCMDGGQIDLSETGGVGLSITASSTDPADLSNSTENTQKISTVSPKIDSKLQLNSNDLIDAKVESNNEGALNNDANLNTAVEEKTQLKEKDEGKEKTDYKREANTNEFDNSYASEEMECPDDLSEILNEETELTNNRNSYKREAIKDDDLDEAMKTLEESFPNSKSYDEASADPSNLAPLVRVKRRNDEVKKRAVNISPSAYSSENEDEDNEEASEFDDEGYNEHLSNLEKNYANRPNDEVALVDTQPQELVKDAQLAPSQRCSNDNTIKENDAMSLGSDSDSVITGVKGVDENLMYNGASRNKRNMDRFYKPEVDLNRFLRTTSVVDNDLQPTADNMQLGSYQENDAFGPLPRSYEGDLGRYKRVRQVKQLPE